MTRRMADRAFRTSQEDTAATAPHLGPINAFVAGISEPDPEGFVPRIAPHHGGTDARVLSVLRDPGPATQVGVGSGFLSIEDATIHPGRQALFHPDPAERERREAHQVAAYARVGQILSDGARS
ncbi:hypothetical protein ACAD32_00089 [Clavibacter nebraskensis]|uniref:Uncharacterized protein n=2 Tax=Clavibacter nebraskensis TaxID=31963 RepID=A0A399PF13_9MICO|nr:hypothetical protein DZF97_14130 [Clavibacter nebraskensis]UKF28377.1 hypothetical protein FGQ65_09310 [Clavibacter nebraskensis]